MLRKERKWSHIKHSLTPQKRQKNMENIKRNKEQVQQTANSNKYGRY